MTTCFMSHKCETFAASQVSETGVGSLGVIGIRGFTEGRGMEVLMTLKSVPWFSSMEVQFDFLGKWNLTRLSKDIMY